MVTRLNEPTKSFLFQPKYTPKQPPGIKKKPVPNTFLPFSTYLQQAMQKDVN